MPELPEVETIRADLSRALKGKRILSLKAQDEKLLKNSLAEIRQHLVGAVIKLVERRAKLLVIKLSNQYALLIHLKMTGQLVWRSPAGKIRAGGHPIIHQVSVPNKYTHIILTLSGGGKLFFNDVRKFGYWRLLKQEALDEHFSHYGPEPLGQDFTVDRFIRGLSRRKLTSIKAALLDQTIVSGLGNIYVDESLFVAGIRPTRRTISLSRVDVEGLHKAIIKVLRRAVKARGTSFNSYVDALGKKGTYWQKRYVYGRAGEKCLRCGGLVKRTVLAGRGTHYCANCQH